MEVRPFTDKQIALLETFADQAVIAIENVRLFKEFRSATQNCAKLWSIRRQRAEVLGIISQLADGRAAGAGCHRRERRAGLWDRRRGDCDSHEGNMLSVQRAHFGPIPIGAGVEISIDEPRYSAGCVEHGHAPHS